jgi:uncharacterized protein YtpQ (UPF0354 family)
MSFLQQLLSSKRQSVMSAGDFAQAYAKSAEQRYPGARVQVEEADAVGGIEVLWNLSDGSQVNQHLGNAYQAYAKNPTALDAILAMHLDSSPACHLTDASERRANILPLVKSRVWLNANIKQIRAAGIDNPEPFTTEALADDLLVVYVEDRPDAMRYLTGADLEALEVPRERVRSIAVQNLKRFVPQITIEGKDGRYGVRLEGNYDASLIFIPEAWRNRIDIEGELIMAVPARDELLVCGSADDSDVRDLRHMAAQIMARTQHGLSAQLYTWRDGLLTVYTG